MSRNKKSPLTLGGLSEEYEVKRIQRARELIPESCRRAARLGDNKLRLAPNFLNLSLLDKDDHELFRTLIREFMENLPPDLGEITIELVDEKPHPAALVSW